MDELRKTGQLLRLSVERGAYEEARLRLAEYARHAARLVGALPAGEDRAEVARESLALLMWAARVVRADRGHAAAEHARLMAARPYLAAAGSFGRGRRWEG